MADNRANPRITGIQHDVEDIKRHLESIGNHRNGTQNVTQVTFSAGGFGLWIAVTACLMMLVLNVVLGVLYLDLSRKLDRMQDHLSAIYVIAPSLKPKE